MTTIGEASLRPGDVVDTEDFGTLRVVLTDPKAFYGFKVASGSPTLRLENYENIEEYRAREHVDDDEVRAELFDDETTRPPAHGDRSHDETPARAKEQLEAADQEGDDA